MTKGVQGIIFNDCVTYGSLWQRSAGAYRIATELRLRGYSIQVIDYWSFMTLEGPDMVKALLDKFMGSETLFVGFSTTFMTTATAMHHNRKVATKEAHNQKHRGANAMATPEDILAEVKLYVHQFNPKIDILVGGARANGRDPIGTVRVLGYGEKHMVDYMQWKTGKLPLLSPRIDDNVRIFDYDMKADAFDFHNSQILWTDQDCIQRGETLPIEVSRGCIFRCKFCSFPLNGKNKVDYLKKPEVLREEFQRNYDKWGITNYILADDTYNDTTEKLEWMNGILAPLSFKIKFATYLRLDLIAAHPEQADLLLENGLAAGFFGIESLYTPAGKSIGKGMKSERIIETLHWLHETKWKNDVITTAGFILGLPHETYQTAERWMTRVIDRRFPLHCFEFSPLNMIDKKKVKQVFYSEIELDPIKYGYDMSGPEGWVNNLYGTTFRGCNALGIEATKYMSETGRNTVSSFPAMTAIGYDYTTEQILRLSSLRVTTGKLKSMVYSRYFDYLDDLFALETP